MGRQAVYEFQEGLYGFTLFVGVDISDELMRQLFHPYKEKVDDNGHKTGRLIKQDFANSIISLTSAYAFMSWVILKQDDTQHGAIMPNTSRVVYEFTTDVYPFPIFIGYGVKGSAVRRLFCKEAYKLLDLKDVQFRGRKAYTLPVSMRLYRDHKELWWNGIFVNINADQPCNIGTITSEACRVADWIFDKIDFRYWSVVESEPHAYLVGAIAEYIAQVVEHRVDKRFERWSTTDVDHMLDAEIEDEIKAGRIIQDENGHWIRLPKSDTNVEK